MSDPHTSDQQPTGSQVQDATPTGDRVVHVVLVLVITCAVIGVFVGLVPAVPSWERHSPHAIEPATDARPMPAYLAMNGKERGPNAQYVTDIANLNSHRPALTDPVLNSAADKAATLLLRASRRAYAGAPPTIPHPVDANNSTNCLVCHGNGIQVDGHIAPKISHQTFTNCTQCHAQAGTPGMGPEFPVSNSFGGLESPTQGKRAWPGAPPTMPHQMWMREDCTSCHGVMGRPGIRTTHPWRMNCVQCHASSAAFDHRQHEDDLPPFPDPVLAPNTSTPPNTPQPSESPHP